MWGRFKYITSSRPEEFCFLPLFYYVLYIYNNMKRKDFKYLIKECVTEVISEMSGVKISADDRKKINNEFHKRGELGGTVKIDQKGKALNIIAQILDQYGYSLDMVPADIIMGDQGTRLLPYRKKGDPSDVYSEGPEVINSRISFSWQNVEESFHLSRNAKSPRWEIVAYLS
jgi:hypothetical protein